MAGSQRGSKGKSKRRILLSHASSQAEPGNTGRRDARKADRGLQEFLGDRVAYLEGGLLFLRSQVVTPLIEGGLASSPTPNSVLGFGPRANSISPPLTMSE